jgi:hypothetical protein
MEIKNSRFENAIVIYKRRPGHFTKRVLYQLRLSHSVANSAATGRAATYEGAPRVQSLGR